MRKPLLSFAVVVFAAALAAAQSAPPDTVCEVHVNKIKPGMTSQYEQGRAKHMAWHKSQNDSWSWNTWEITTGPDSGSYLISTCGHAWKDFDGRDKFNVADLASVHYRQTVAATNVHALGHERGSPALQRWSTPASASCVDEAVNQKDGLTRHAIHVVTASQLFVMPITSWDG